MILNDIEYNIRLYVTNEETEEDITEEIFENLDQMNEFLDKTWRLDEFEDAIGEYVFVEVIDEVPEEDGRYFFELPVYMPLEPGEIEDVIYEMDVAIPKERVEERPFWEKNQVFEPEHTGVAPGDVSKKYPLSEYVYLCHRCLNEVEQCTCPTYPMHLIQIDRLIAPVIRELNLKGYSTSSCCAGHPDYESLELSQLMYISFRERYRFPVRFPKGAKYAKEGDSLLFCVDENMDKSEIKKYQQECIENLMKWAKMLPPIRS